MGRRERREGEPRFYDRKVYWKACTLCYQTILVAHLLWASSSEAGYCHRMSTSLGRVPREPSLLAVLYFVARVWKFISFSFMRHFLALYLYPKKKKIVNELPWRSFSSFLLLIASQWLYSLDSSPFLWKSLLLSFPFISVHPFCLLDKMFCVSAIPSKQTVLLYEKNKKKEKMPWNTTKSITCLQD